jgi:hypothetical protein
MRNYPIVQKIISIVGNDVYPSLFIIGNEIFARLPEWPKDDQGDGENLDLENFQIFEIKENSMLVSAGGDWQFGKIFWIELNGETFETTPFDFSYREAGLVAMNKEEVLKLFYPAYKTKSDDSN